VNDLSFETAALRGLLGTRSNEAIFMVEERREASRTIASRALPNLPPMRSS
jgi:hypothetical protein